MTENIDAKEAQQQLFRLLKSVLAGNEVIISDGSTPVARLSAVIPAAPKPRVMGLHAGSMSITDDFSEPLPDEFWTGTA